MVFAAGSKLVDDIRKAPDDVLSMMEPVNEVRWRAKRRAHTHIGSPVATSRIHDETIGRKCHVPREHNSLPINTECCSYFQGGPRRAHHGNGRFNPNMRGQCVEKSKVKRLFLTKHAEWVKVPILDTLQRVVCRATNRIFVGAPLCS